ncbi:TetR/AcrR family transcriptional regulator [Sphaerisporangium sp. NPDC051011]|uniref:TetR/AcrR family transcriptional regulator n=1 Tax=Sphaerisporangium sp. NPDC051011 TaxID=3155792 RepID=UPI0033D750DE
MGRPRGFDETEVVRAAAALFAHRAYDGVSIDDLVAHLGIHRNSLYKTFGSKRGLYMAALRWHVENQVRPLILAIGEAHDFAEAARRALPGQGDGSALDLLLMAAVERAPADPEVAAEVTAVLDALDEALAVGPTGGIPTPGLAGALTSALLGLRLRARTASSSAGSEQAGAALARHLAPHNPDLSP